MHENIFFKSRNQFKSEQQTYQPISEESQLIQLNRHMDKILGASASTAIISMIVAAWSTPVLDNLENADTGFVCSLAFVSIMVGLYGILHKEDNSNLVD